MATKDYSSTYSIKEFAIDTIAPRYFDTEDNVNMLSMGMMGFATDMAATMTEDTFNSFSIYLREIFPTIAQMPETIYNHAARLRVDNLFATPSSLGMVLFVEEKNIREMGTAKNNFIEFVLDSNMVIDIEGKQFMLDYDIRITAKKQRNEFVYTAAYDLNYTNSGSSIKNPYIKTIRTKVGSDNKPYLGLIVNVHQVQRTEQLEYIINNDKINYPTLTLNFENQMANFEVFYKAPDVTGYVQLSKRLFNTPPVKDPFCFYRIKDDQTLEISFTSRDNYFQPKFNSEILFRVFTTTGSEGNFPEYTGDGITVMAKSDVYEYNNSIVLFAVTQSASTGGIDKLTLEQIRTIVIERASTSGAYNTETDLQLYFANNSKLTNTDVFFIKQRDDVLLRLFSAFSKIKDTNGDIYPTNTLNITLGEDNFDDYFEQSNRYILKPGSLFKYKPNSLDQVEIIPGKTIQDDLTQIAEEFIYTNPFMMTVSKTQGIVGYYLNSLDSKYQLDYTFVNGDSNVQFICNSVSVKRNAMRGENAYTFTIVLTPASDTDLGIIDDQGVDLGRMTLRGFVEDVGKVETAYFDFTLKSADPTAKLYIFEATLETDDYMTNTERIRVHAKDVETGASEEKLIPMNDCIINFGVFYKYPDGTKIPHKYEYLDELKDFSLTNIYSSIDNRINLITPINIMRSQFKFIKNNDSFLMSISAIPFVRASVMKSTAAYNTFLETLYKQYDFMKAILDQITTNFGVDMKFYNTYGKAKHLSLNGDGDILDKVNCAFRFKVAFDIGTNEVEAVNDLKLFIKDYVENINSSDGYNSIHISNLTREIENKFENIDHLIFVGINNYPSSVQSIVNRAVDVESMTNEERRRYVPEFLTLSLDDIVIEIISN